MIIDYVFENLSDLNFIQMELYLTQLKNLIVVIDKHGFMFLFVPIEIAAKQ